MNIRLRGNFVADRIQLLTKASIVYYTYNKSNQVKITNNCANNIPVEYVQEWHYIYVDSVSGEWNHWVDKGNKSTFRWNGYIQIIKHISSSTNALV